MINKLKEIPKKTWGYLVLGFIVLVTVLKLLSKWNALNAKERNLSALLKHAVDMAQVKINKDKIKELKKEIDPKELVKDSPEKVLDFYKKRKK